MKVKILPRVLDILNMLHNYEFSFKGVCGQIWCYFFKIKVGFTDQVVCVIKLKGALRDSLLKECIHVSCRLTI